MSAVCFVTTYPLSRQDLGGSGWELLPSAYDASSKTLSVEVTDLPTTVVAVDDSRPADPPGWDPQDPAAIQFADGRSRLLRLGGVRPHPLVCRANGTA